MLLDEDFGYIKIKLGDYIANNNIKKNKLSFKAELQITQLNKWVKGEITQVDLHVLARICKTLGCKVSDILEYIPVSEEKEKGL